jgi:hypothetical protein
MKRISMLLVLSAFLPGLCQAYYYGGYSSNYLVRYTPYALSYNSTGLVPGGITYSPYAFGAGQSGLVYEGTRYTPYAFNYYNSGLIMDYSASPYPVYPPQVIVVSCPHSGRASQIAIPPVRATMNRSYGRDDGSRRDKDADPTQTIRQYLAGRGFNSIDTNYLWRAEGKTVCVSFVLRDKGLAIRYSDPKVVESLSATQRNSGASQERSWEAFAKDFSARGGSVYSVSASGREQIVAALDACSALRPQDGTATDAVRFAKE